MDNYLKDQDFIRNDSEHTLCIKSSDNLILSIVSLYVDDLFVTGPDGSYVDDFKIKMQQEFDMSDLGKMSYFLGSQID